MPSVAEELGKAAAVASDMIASIERDDNSLLFHVRRSALHYKWVLQSHAPTLFHPSLLATSNFLYGSKVPLKDDVAYKKGLWSPPQHAMLAGACICDVNSPKTEPVPALILLEVVPEESCAGETAKVTLFCPSTPLGSLEHELFDANLAPSLFQTQMLGEIAKEEHERRTGAQSQLTTEGLKSFPDFLLGSAYHLRRSTVLPFLRLRNADTEEEVNLLRRLRSKGNFGNLKQVDLKEALVAHENTVSDYRFEVVFQSTDVAYNDTGERFETLPKQSIVAPLVDLILWRSVGGASLDYREKMWSFEQHNDYVKFLDRLKESEVSHTPSSTVTRKFQDRNLAALDVLSRKTAQTIYYGYATRLKAAVCNLFSTDDAAFLEAEFAKAESDSVEADLHILAKFLDPGQLVLLSKLNSNGLIASTTCFGKDVCGISVGLDSLSRLCTLPWVVHLVEAAEGLSRRLPLSLKPKLMSLNARVGPASDLPAAAMPLLNVSKLDFEQLVTRVEEVKQAVLEKRKREVDTDEENAPPEPQLSRGSFHNFEEVVKTAMSDATAAATTAIDKIAQTAESAIAKALAAQPLATTTADASASAQPPLLPPASLPTGVSALRHALAKLHRDDEKLTKRIRALAAAS